MSSINTNATVTLTVNGKQAQDMLDNLKKKSQDLEKAIEELQQIIPNYHASISEEGQLYGHNI